MFGRHDPLKVPRRFVDCLNARDVQGLGEVLDDECRIIDARGDWLEGRETCLEALQRFFEIEPNFRIHIETIGRNGADVLITGRTIADDPRLGTTTAWRARTDGRRIHEWQSYAPVRGPAISRMLGGDKARQGPFPERY